jgi:hypothetical protein
MNRLIDRVSEPIELALRRVWEVSRSGLVASSDNFFLTVAVALVGEVILFDGLFFRGEEFGLASPV